MHSSLGNKSEKTKKKRPLALAFLIAHTVLCRVPYRATHEILPEAHGREPLLLEERRQRPHAGTHWRLPGFQGQLLLGLVHSAAMRSGPFVGHHATGGSLDTEIYKKEQNENSTSEK